MYSRVTISFPSLRSALKPFLEADLKSGENPIRTGQMFQDYYDEKCRQMRGDATNGDLQGLIWRFHIAIEENKRDANVATWSQDDINFTRYILNNVLHSFDPGSDYFRKDLIR